MKLGNALTLICVIVALTVGAVGAFSDGTPEQKQAVEKTMNAIIDDAKAHHADADWTRTRQPLGDNDVDSFVMRRVGQATVIVVSLATPRNVLVIDGDTTVLLQEDVCRLAKWPGRAWLLPGCNAASRETWSAIYKESVELSELYGAKNAKIEHPKPPLDLATIGRPPI